MKVSPDFSTTLRLSGNYWHDGRLRQLTYAVGEEFAEVVLRVEVYADERVPARDSRCFRFIDVEDFVMTARSAEMQDHFVAGHIIQARLHESDRLELSVYLTVGYLRISARTVEECA